jgi:CHAT domain-containing protein
VRAAIGAATTIYLSPDGALNLVPFAALVDEQDRYLIERFTFDYISSGRDLVRPPNPATGTAAVVVGDPAFDGGSDQPATGSGVPATRGLADHRFERLPGTAAEAQAIARLLGTSAVYTGANATETAVKSVAAPRVLHIATHGFFLADQELSVPPGAQADLEDPMLRSGLAFAGVNAGHSGDDDGVLTALEAAALNLAGTQLVVLSACETGVGDVRTGEGVFGLRRAFTVAGGETLVMSLWQVEDSATQQLMSEFYVRLARGEGRIEALRQASLTLMRDPEHRHPFFWASFIASGEPGPLHR